MSRIQNGGLVQPNSALAGTRAREGSDFLLQLLTPTSTPGEHRHDRDAVDAIDANAAAVNATIEPTPIVPLPHTALPLQMSESPLESTHPTARSAPPDAGVQAESTRRSISGAQPRIDEALWLLALQGSLPVGPQPLPTPVPTRGSTEPTSVISNTDPFDGSLGVAETCDARESIQCIAPQASTPAAIAPEVISTRVIATDAFAHQGSSAEPNASERTVALELRAQPNLQCTAPKPLSVDSASRAITPSTPLVASNSNSPEPSTPGAAERSAAPQLLYPQLLTAIGRLSYESAAPLLRASASLNDSTQSTVEVATHVSGPEAPTCASPTFNASSQHSQLTPTLATPSHLTTTSSATQMSTPAPSERILLAALPWAPRLLRLVVDDDGATSIWLRDFTLDAGGTTELIDAVRRAAETASIPLHRILLNGHVVWSADQGGR